MRVQFLKNFLTGCLYAYCSYGYAAGEKPMTKLAVPAVNSKANEFIFKGVEGPHTTTLLPNQHPYTVDKYTTGAPSRLGILLTDPNSSWVELMRGLHAMGVPAYLIPYTPNSLIDATNNLAVLMVYPSVTDNILSPDDLTTLQNYVVKGGTLIGINPINTLGQLFGFDSTLDSTAHYQFILNAKNALNKPFKFKQDLTLPITNADDFTYNFSSNDFQAVTATSIVASYEDKTPAIIQNNVGKGQAIAFSFDLGNYLAIGYTEQFSFINKETENTYLPTLDNLLRIIKQIYVLKQPDAVIINSVPANKNLVMIFTHNVNDLNSLDNALAHAKYEKQQGISATYFIKVKYFSDNYGKVYYNSKAVTILNQLYNMGMEIGSQSVTNNANFPTFHLGTGQETYPTYLPGFGSIKNTILGELRVSKFLLDSTVTNLAVLSHCPGTFQTPAQYTEALKGVEYRFASSVMADKIRTHFAFQKNYDNQLSSPTDIYEFPVSFADYKFDITKSLTAMTQMANQIATSGGCMVVSITSDTPATKLPIEQGLVNAVKKFTWFGNISQFGKWWYAREEVQVDVSDSVKNKQKIVTVFSPVPIKDLTLTFPAKWVLVPKSAPAGIVQTGHTVNIPALEGVIDLIFTY